MNVTTIKALAITAVSAALIGLDASPAAAQAGAPSLSLDIVTACENGSATFKVRNAGKGWPKASTFSVYRVKGEAKQLLAKRRMRLKSGQRALFRINPSHAKQGELALWIDPKWYDRGFNYDATVKCGR